MNKQTNAISRGLKSLFLLLAGCALLVGLPLHGATFTVNTTADTVDVNPGNGIAADSSGNCSVRAAIMEANALPGTDKINIPAGKYRLTRAIWREDNCTGGDLDILDDVKIYGAGKDFTFIEGVRDRVFHIKGYKDVRIEKLTVRFGSAPGGVPFPTSPPDYDGLDATGAEGGGILLEYGELVLVKCAITHNNSGRGGGFMTPREGGHGGAIYNAFGDLVISDCNIERNITGNGGYYSAFDIDADGGDGGAIYNESGVVTLQGTFLAANGTGSNGGATVTWSYTGEGGAIYNDGGICYVNYCDLYDNYTGDVPGCMECSGGNGGAVYNDGVLKVDHTTIRSNKTGDGGFDGFGGHGGGIYNRDDAIVDFSVIYDNETGAGDEYPCACGAGIYNRSAMTVTNTTISGNRHASTGGYYLGAGVYNWQGTLTLESCTVAENETDWDGAGVYNDTYAQPSSTLYMHNTIVANNFITWSGTPDDCWGDITSQGYNLIEDTANCTILGVTTGNIYGTDPQLGLLADNGGATLTHALVLSSPCIDTGDSGAYEPSDQRDIVRPQDGDGNFSKLPDIGAYEKTPPFRGSGSPVVSRQAKPEKSPLKK